MGQLAPCLQGNEWWRWGCSHVENCLRVVCKNTSVRHPVNHQALNGWSDEVSHLHADGWQSLGICLHQQGTLSMESTWSRVSAAIGKVQLLQMLQNRDFWTYTENTRILDCCYLIIQNTGEKIPKGRTNFLQYFWRNKYKKNRLSWKWFLTFILT